MLTNWSGVSATSSGRPRFVSKDSPARATGVSAHESDDGNALPECVEAGGVSVIRERVEADIDAMVELQIPRARLPGDEGHAIAAYAFPFEQIQGTPANRARRGQEQEPRAIDGRENLRP